MSAASAPTMAMARTLRAIADELEHAEDAGLERGPVDAEPFPGNVNAQGRPPEVLGAVRYCTDRLDRLDAIVDELAQRLAPVRGPGSATPADCAVGAHRSILGDLIGTVGNRIDLAADRLAGITQELEV